MSRKFVDLKTGNLFDGSSPYVFWFDGQQSTNLIYSKPICFVSTNDEEIVTIENNPVFCLVDTSRFENPTEINGVQYQDISKIKSFEITSIGKPYKNFYVHIFYVLGTSSVAGEMTAEFKIGEGPFYVGADFYGENESLYVNLSNNGIEIPEQIQKALYTTNIHEDKRDNITLNRKWKELLSNYLDVVGNKGSYKSLLNSLKWFEYGDIVRLKEIWKMTDNDIERFTERELLSTSYKQYSEVLRDFQKTTYLAMYCAMKALIPNKYDEEYNPVLEDVVFDWSLKDMMLKLSLLGNFYETYFMPIHLDLIHSTIEDVVYTNTFKRIAGTSFERNDFVDPTPEMTCNIEDGSIYRLSLVECYVTDDTLFGSDFAAEKDTIVGVSYQPLKSVPANPGERNAILKKYFKQLYRSIGSIVDIHVDIPLVSGDSIVREDLWFKTYSSENSENGEIKDIWKHREEARVIESGSIDFSLLCTCEGDYEVRMQFASRMGKVYNKVIRFSVIDTEHVGIKVYKMKNMQCPVNISSQRASIEWDKNDEGEHTLYHPENDNTVRLTNYNNFNLYPSAELIKYTQCIPAKNVSPYKSDWDGVCFNHLMILEGDAMSDYHISRDYFMSLKHVKNYIKNDQGEVIDTEIVKTYTICISRKFGHKVESRPGYYDGVMYTYRGYPIYRSTYTFMRDYHKLVELGKDTIYEDRHIGHYEVTDDDTLCVIPELAFGKHISGYVWVFRNESTGEEIKVKNVREPFIANSDKTHLTPGYYSIFFRYRLTNEDKINEISLESAFIKQ